MGENGKAPRSSRATTFRKDEIDLLDKLFKQIARGGDMDVLRRAPAFNSVWQKVQRMKDSLSGTE